MNVNFQKRKMYATSRWMFILFNKERQWSENVRFKKKETQQAVNFNFRNKGNITVIECRFLEIELQQSVTVDS